MSFLYNKFLFFEFRVVLERTGASLSGSQVRERVSGYWTGLGSGPVVFRPNVGLHGRSVLGWRRHFGGLGLLAPNPTTYVVSWLYLQRYTLSFQPVPNRSSASVRFGEPAESPATEPGRRRSSLLGRPFLRAASRARAFVIHSIELCQSSASRQRCLYLVRGRQRRFRSPRDHKKTQQRITKSSHKITRARRVSGADTKNTRKTTENNIRAPEIWWARTSGNP